MKLASPRYVSALREAYFTATLLLFSAPSVADMHVAGAADIADTSLNRSPKGCDGDCVHGSIFYGELGQVCQCPIQCIGDGEAPVAPCVIVEVRLS